LKRERRGRRERERRKRNEKMVLIMQLTVKDPNEYLRKG
jgi:hypothetical protein